jgi:hypothetical protein
MKRLLIFLLLLGAAHAQMAAFGTKLSAQQASIATTTIYPSAPVGLYEVCWSSRISQKATTSSSLTVTIGWNNGGAQTKANAALASNVLNAQDQACIAIDVADQTNITFATAYVSSGATVMQYSLKVSVVRLL